MCPRGRRPPAAARRCAFPCLALACVVSCGQRRRRSPCVVCLARRCIKCLVPDEMLPFVLKKDGTCVQCEANLCEKCDANKPTKCLKCSVGLPLAPRCKLQAAGGLAKGPRALVPLFEVLPSANI